MMLFTWKKPNNEIYGNPHFAVIVNFVVFFDFVWIFDECKCSNIFPIQQVTIPFLPFSMSQHSMATNPVTAARRLPQKGGRVETDLEAKHRVSHYDWCGQGPSRIDIKGIIFTIHIYVYIYIYIHIYIYMYTYICIHMQFETDPGLILFHRVGNQKDVLLALNMHTTSYNHV